MPSQLMDDIRKKEGVTGLKEKARRDQAVDRKDWATYAALHTDDFVGTAIPGQQAAGGKAAAAALEVQMANVTTVHHSHSPVIEFQDRDHATGVWAMEDNLFWKQGDEEHWFRGFGFYYETYERRDGQWLFTERTLRYLYTKASEGAVLNGRPLP